MEILSSFLMLLILQISTFNSVRFEASSCGFESCNFDHSYDDSYDDFLPTADNRFYMDIGARRCTAEPSNQAPPLGKNKALNIAKSAADAAQAANEVLAGAAHEASRQVKMELADKAMDAARTAQAVFEVSLAAVHNLAREIRDEERLMEQMRVALEASEANAYTAKATCKRVGQQAAFMQAQLQQTRTNLAHLDALVEQASADLESKNRVLAMIKERVELLSKRTQQAKCDYKQAKDAACRAATKKKAKKKQFASKKCPPVWKLWEIIPRNNGGLRK